MATHHNSAKPLTHPRMAVGSVVAACYPGNRFGLGVLEIQQSADSDAPRGPREPKDAFASAVYTQTKAEQAPAQQNCQGPHICRTASSGLRFVRRTRGLCPCPQRAGRRRRGQSSGGRSTARSHSCHRPSLPSVGLHGLVEPKVLNLSDQPCAPAQSVKLAPRISETGAPSYAVSPPRGLSM